MNHLNFLYCNKKIVKLTKYLISGGLAAMVSLFTLYILTDWFHVWYLYSSVLSFLCAFGVSFSLQKFWTFQDFSTEKSVSQTSLYFLVAVFNLIANTSILYLLVEYGGLWYLLSQIIASLLVAVYSFFIYNFVIFNKKSKLKEVGFIGHGWAEKNYGDKVEAPEVVLTGKKIRL